MLGTLPEPPERVDLHCDWEADGTLVLGGAAVNDLTPVESRQLEASLRAFVAVRIDEIRERRVARAGALA